jgi:hypothetical protein
LKKLWNKLDEYTLAQQIVLVFSPAIALGIGCGILLHLLFPNFGHYPVANAPAAPSTTVEVTYLPGETITIVPTPGKKQTGQAHVTTPSAPKALPATTTVTSPEVTVSSSQPTPSTVPTPTSSLPLTSEEPPPASTSEAVVPSSTEASPSN